MNYEFKKGYMKPAIRQVVVHRDDHLLKSSSHQATAGTHLTHRDSVEQENQSRPYIWD
jgi:hypothetical protein